MTIATSTTRGQYPYTVSDLVPERSILLNDTAAKLKPKTINGMDESNTRRRPIRSLAANATRVKRKFVTATESAASVGD